jgi:hypothetical protein
MLWDWASDECKIEMADPDTVFLAWGSENHDAQAWVSYWSAAQIFAGHPVYSTYTYADGSTPAEMAALIRAAGRIPVQRNTLYDVLEVFDCHDPVDMAPLVPRQSATPIVPASSCDQPISKYGVDLTRRSSHQHH